MINQPVTTNPLLISLINLTVVFAVLWGLSWMVRLIRYIDPTRKREAQGCEMPAAAKERRPGSAAGDELDKAGVAVILAAAVAAYEEDAAGKAAAIRRTDNPGPT